MHCSGQWLALRTRNGHGFGTLVKGDLNDTDCALHVSCVSRLQRIIRRNDGTETLCTERDGWCLPKTGDDLRDAMSLMIRHTIRSQRPGEGQQEGKDGGVEMGREREGQKGRYGCDMGAGHGLLLRLAFVGSHGEHQNPLGVSQAQF